MSEKTKKLPVIILQEKSPTELELAISNAIDDGYMMAGEVLIKECSYSDFRAYDYFIKMMTIDYSLQLANAMQDKALELYAVPEELGKVINES